MDLGLGVASTRRNPIGLVLSKGVRFFLYRQLGSRDLDDKVHDVFVIVAQAIRRGDLREPERLMGFVMTVVRRQACRQIECVVKERRNHADLEGTVWLADRHPDPEVEVIERDQDDAAKRVLMGLHQRDREVLIRFYLDEQRPETICRDTGLTETQFRLIKSRAKDRFFNMCRSRFKLRRRVTREQAQVSGHLLSA